MPNKRGVPEDKAGNGGGFVFDCRAMPNLYWDESLRGCQSLRQIYATTPNVLSNNDYVAKGDYPKIDQQQLMRLKEADTEDEKLKFSMV